ncbi:uncharacterized protein [Macaca nemestrina]|uniref:uncharacterized protein isoform X5 n=1 Tax=Macaca nemestrina TaxID=9545 RepID=UPI0039B965DA
MCLSCSLSAHRWVLCHIPGTKSQDQEEHTKPKDKSLTGAHRSPAGDFYCSSLTSRSGARVGLANAHVQGASAGHRDPYRRPGDKSLRLGEAGKAGGGSGSASVSRILPDLSRGLTGCSSDARKMPGFVEGPQLRRNLRWSPGEPMGDPSLRPAGTVCRCWECHS